MKPSSKPSPTSRPRQPTKRRSTNDRPPPSTRWPWKLVALIALFVASVVGGGVFLTQSRSGGPAAATTAAAADEIAAAEQLALPSTTGADLRLTQLRGSKVVVYFYEGSSCGPCQQQLIELQNALPQIQGFGARVVAVTVEPIETSRSLASQLNLGFAILQDIDHQVGSAFHVFRLTVGMDMGPVDNHSILILDSAGRVAWRELAPETMHVSIDHVLGALKR
jgi:peroxiredoxin